MLAQLLFINKKMIITILNFLFNLTTGFNSAPSVLLDAPAPWQIGFQDVASPGFEGIVALHDSIMFYLILILVSVFWIMFSMIRYFSSAKSGIVYKYLNHGTLNVPLHKYFNYYFPAIFLFIIVCIGKKSFKIKLGLIQILQINLVLRFNIVLIQPYNLQLQAENSYLTFSNPRFTITRQLLQRREFSSSSRLFNTNSNENNLNSSMFADDEENPVVKSYSNADTNFALMSEACNLITSNSTDNEALDLGIGTNSNFNPNSNSNSNENQKNKLNPNYLTGFADAESSFIISILKKVSGKYQVQPSFNIELHQKDLLLLIEIQEYFNNIGTIQLNNNKNSAVFKVLKLKDLTDVIIPHFLNYPLISQKKSDFELFKMVIDLMNNGEHLTKEGFIKILSIRASMNNGLSENLINSFPNINPISRPLVENNAINNPFWLAGFADGESCFNVSINKSKSKTGFTVTLRFIIAQHSRDLLLMKNIQKYLGCGNVIVNDKEKMATLTVSVLSDLIYIIIPFFEKQTLQGSKKLDYMDFCKIANLMKGKNHLTMGGLKEIKEIKLGMNSKRDYFASIEKTTKDGRNN